MASAADVDLEGDVGDWRMALVARVTEDNPPYLKGQIVRQVSAVEYLHDTVLSFTTPSSIAMALNIADKAARAASELRTRLAFHQLQDNKSFSMAIDSLPEFYDFLEQSMIAAIFSYQAIEAFANSVISRELSGAVTILRGRKQRSMMPAELERQLKLADKLTLVLPKARDVESPEGSALWERFIRLEDARHSTVHLTVKDQYAKDRDSLFFKMLHLKATEYPAAAAAIIRYYFESGTEPRWLIRFSERMDII